MDVKRIAYTAANAFPFKIFKSKELSDAIFLHNRVIPLHVQVIPTNHCNLSCKFCSCRNRVRSDELSLAELETLAEELMWLGCKAVTITGGGEPLMHKDINQIIQKFIARDIQVGLVTNGILLGVLSSEILRSLCWCRISCSDDREYSRAREVIRGAWEKAPKIDWAFSYVISRNFKVDNLAGYIRFANYHHFTHVRVVSDLCDLESCPDMDTVKVAIKTKAIIKTDDSRVIYQGRKDYMPGSRNCYISLLKPVIGADGCIYPCCGSQYARETQDLDLVIDMRMGHMKDIREIYYNQKWFDGSICHRCYYKEYNDILGLLKSSIQHERFV